MPIYRRQSFAQLLRYGDCQKRFSGGAAAMRTIDAAIKDNGRSALQARLVLKTLRHIWP